MKTIAPKSPRGVVLLAVALLMGCTAGDEPDAVPVPESTELDLMEMARIPGLSVAVIGDGRVAEVKAYGVASVKSGAPVTDGTLFEAASLSKPVFATIVLRLAERGELDLDQPLHETLPYERISHDPRSRELTPRLVLSHRTGLPNWGPERLEFQFEPGERFGYSGEGFVYLQKAVERLTGLSLEELASREIFEPLGMTHSRFSIEEDEALDLADPHDLAGRPQTKSRPTTANAAASLHTTAEDYARFVAAWMSDALLPRSTIEMALQPVSPVQADDDASPAQRAAAERIAWSLGWGLQLPESGQSRTIAFHWGDNGDFKAFVAFDASTRRGVAYFTNGFNGLTVAEDLVSSEVGELGAALTLLGYGRYDDPGWEERIEALIAEGEGRLEDAISGFEAYLEARSAVDDADDEATVRRIGWLRELMTALESPVEIPLETLTLYAGDYGPRMLALKEGELWYQRQGRPAYRLIALSDTLFALENLVDFRIEVVLDSGGEPAKLVGHYVQGNTDENPRSPRPSAAP